MERSRARHSSQQTALPPTRADRTSDRGAVRNRNTDRAAGTPRQTASAGEDMSIGDRAAPGTLPRGPAPGAASGPRPQKAKAKALPLAFRDASSHVPDREPNPGPIRKPEKWPAKGRGAVGNPTGRFEKTRTEVFDDGWTPADDDDFVPPILRTQVTEERAKSIVTRNTSPDVPFDKSVNAYRGCEHGCIYCFARPSHAFMGLSPGLDFESRLFAKPDAPALLETELSHPSYRCEVIAMGTNTDPYQPIERTRKITRGLLEVLSAFNNPTGIVTKSALIARDIDILGDMAARNLVTVGISVTTLDRRLARRMEPRAATPAKRLATIRSLSEAGIPVRVMMSPVVPGLTDTELEDILEAARDAGAISASFLMLRLPLEVKDLFSDWLDTHVPKRAKHVLNLIRDMRDGKLNDPNFGTRFTGSGPYARMIERRFTVATRKLGLARQMAPLDTTRFGVPGRGTQLSLFG